MHGGTVSKKWHAVGRQGHDHGHGQHCKEARHEFTRNCLYISQIEAKRYLDLHLANCVGTQKSSILPQEHIPKRGGINLQTPAPPVESEC